MAGAVLPKLFIFFDFSSVYSRVIVDSFNHRVASQLVASLEKNAVLLIQ